jgi:hypothetical protein
MTSFAALKKNSTSNLEKLTKAIQALNSTESSATSEDKFWKPELDRSGNGYAVIRFLDAPAVDGDDALPWVKIFDHGFQGPTGKWYIENSLTTIGQKDPLSEHNSALWNSGIEANKEIARKQKRRLKYYANILVIEDSKNPENEGKVMLFKFGKKIFEKINNAMNPEFEDEKPFNPFDFWKGANFKLKIRKVEGYQNYDKSEFEAPSALFDGDDDRIEQIWKQSHSLKAFLDPKEFKSYDELKAKLDMVLGLSGGAGNAVRSTAADFDDEVDAPVAKAVAPKPKAKITEVTDEDDDLNYFASLVDE